MKIATHDRGEVLNLAGANHLSPAVVDGRPCLVAEGETAGRAGWAAFFEALHVAGLVVSWDTDDPSSAAAIPAAEGGALVRHPGLAAGMDRARRLVEALRGRPPAGGAAS